MNRTLRNRSCRRRRGFTLTELLVVIGILVVLVSLGVPMAMRAYRNAEVSRVRLDLQAITTALEQYKHDHGDYPRVLDYGEEEAYRGAIVLTRALIAPGPRTGPYADGADGPGFRLQSSGGQVYGPYLKPEAFKMSGDETNPDGPLDLARPMLFDKSGKPILYFPARGTKPDLSQANNYVAARSAGTRPLYIYDDNTAVAASASAMSKLLGDTNGNGAIDAGETAKYTGPFILWCTGPDGEYGNEDDVTNFNE